MTHTVQQIPGGWLVSRLCPGCEQPHPVTTCMTVDDARLVAHALSVLGDQATPRVTAVPDVENVERMELELPDSGSWVVMSIEDFANLVVAWNQSLTAARGGA